MDGLVQTLVADAEKRIDEAVADGQLTEEQADEIKEGLARRIDGARQRRAPRTWRRLPSAVLAGSGSPRRATGVRRPDRVGRLASGPGLRSLAPAGLLRAIPSIEGCIPRSRGVTRSRDCIPRTRDYKESGERGREPRARLRTGARCISTPTGRGTAPLPVSPQIGSQDDPIAQRRPVARRRRSPAYGSQASPPVSQPIRTCAATSARDPLQEAPDRRSPSTQSSPTSAPWKTIGRTHPSRLVGSPACGPSDELAVLEEARSRPTRSRARRRARAPSRAGRRRRPRSRSGCASICFESSRAHSSRSPPSNARTAARSSSGTGVGRRDSGRRGRAVCCAVTMSASSGRRYAAHS